MKLYKKLAREVERYNRCIETFPLAALSASEEITTLMNEMPSGSGWDCGTEIDLSESTANKLVLTGSYHHMDDAGGYDGWTEHKIIITPSLCFNYDMRITGRDRNGIKEHLTDLFSAVLDMEMDGAAIS